MTDKKISGLTSASTPLAGTEVLPIVQSGATVKVAVADLTAGRSVSVGSLLVNTASVGAGSAKIVSDIFGAVGSCIATRFSAPGSDGIGWYCDYTGTTGTAYQAFFKYNGGGVGSITSTAVGTAFNVASDERLKNDLGIVTETNVIADTKIHEVVYKADKDKTQLLSVMAQEALLVNPQAVTVGGDEIVDGSLVNPWFVDYSKYVPALIVEVQSLRRRVQKLESVA